MKLKVSKKPSDMTKNGSTKKSKNTRSKSGSKSGSKSRSVARGKAKAVSKTSTKTSTKTTSKSTYNEKLSDFVLSLMNRTMSGGIGDENRLTVDDIFRLIDLIFHRDFYAYRHLPNSYDKFINETIPDFLMNNEHVFTEAITEQRVIRHKFEFTNVRADTPKQSNEVDPLFPADARKLMQTYQMNIYADVTQFREVVDINATGEKKIQKEKVGVTEEGMVVMIVPTMLRSQYCNLNAHPDETTDECRYDPGGYFIINGSEKIVIAQDKMIPNHPMVILKKGSNTAFHMVQVNSTSDELSNMMQTVSIRIKKDGVMVMKFPILYEVNPMIVFRALGIESDADIAEICVNDKTDYHMMDLVRTSLDHCYNDNREGSKIKIRTQEEAIDYLITKMKVVRRYTETNQAIKHEQKKLHLMELLKTSLLPHIKGTSDSPYREKALYMGYMINKLMRVELGRDEVDNRDSYRNKRVANINELLTEIMIQQYKSNMSECNKKFLDWMKDKLATEEPHNVIHHFKASVFEQGFKSALMQGNWPRAKGVSQMLNRISYLQLLSFLSRIDSQSTSKSSSKLTKPRLTDPSSVPLLCPVQTPEHAKVGLIKHLSMIGSLTIGDKDNTEVVREFIMTYPDVEKITDVKIHELKTMFKVFLNGEWIGMIKNHYEVGQSFMDNPTLRFFTTAKRMKITGKFDPQMTSVVLDSDDGEIRFNTDSGRLYRPVLRVTGDNELVLTKKMIDRISLKAENTDKITVWDDFYTMDEYPIEFIDSEEQPYYMFAPMIKDLNAEREKILNSRDYKFEGREDKVTNRYNENFFIRYDYCEIHPSVLLGEIATNIPFPNRNQGPRNIFQYAQGRQGMGIYNTVYRSRTDISYVLYHPETPIVNTRTAKYTYTDVLGPGSNAIVAIATYGGYNQEDSLVFNMTSLQRALFRSMSLKKYMSQITKNQETSANDKFMKPTPDKTLGMKHGNYEKLNMEGYVPEETAITNGDIIFGKVTPITDMPDSDKIYKDESEMFKSHSDGVIDRIYTGIHNQEGQEVRRALVRMERIPMIGDKFCSRHGQKGTMGIGYNASDMPYTKNGIRPDIIMNPNAIPSRMTIGQFWEQLMGKVGALLGINMDATAFEDYDIEAVKTLLKSQGYDETGEEYLYNGMTGQRMKTSIFIAPAFYQRLKHMVQDKLHCLTGDTDVLTASGWKNITEVTLEDRVATLENDELKYVNPTEVHHYPEYEGNMYYIKNQAIDLAVTGKHRMWVSKPYGRKHIWTDYQFECAEDIVGKHRRYKKDANWNKPDYQITLPKYDNGKGYVIQENTPDMDSWLKFFGIWIAEGHVCSTKDTRWKNTRSYEVEITQVKENNFDEITNAIEGCGYTWDRHGVKFRICNAQLYAYMEQFSVGAPNKFLPDWVWSLSQRQCRILIDAMILGDGSVAKNGCKFYYTSSVRLRDDFQKLCLHAGYAGMYTLHYAAGTPGGMIDGRQITSTYDMWRISVLTNRINPSVNHGHSKKQNIQEERLVVEKCPVYCLTVPSGVFYVRRNGKSVWTGNSRPRGSMTILVRQAAEGRSRDGGLRLGEMERDALIAHGMAKFMLDKMLYNSDVYSTYICGICGLFAIREVTRNSEDKPRPEDIYKCPMCKNYHDIHKIMIPYAFKLMIQEMMAMNILARIRVKKSDRKIVRTITQ